MAGVHEYIGGPAPPDEWLALSEAERAEVLRRAADLNLVETESARWVAAHVAESEPPGPDAPCCELAPLPTFDDIRRFAESLELDNRIMLTSRLLTSLPLKNRAAVVTLGLESLEDSANNALNRAVINRGPSFGDIVWPVLFDTANTSGLYAAARRFDLATIFVITAAYSLLFGALTAFDGVFDFGPAPLIIVGLVLAVVGAAQALCHGVANPRGVSVIAGGAAFVLFCLLMLGIRPQLLHGWFTVEIVIGLFLAPVWGYIAGVLVGGVFLVADKLRNRIQQSKIESAEDNPEGGDPS